MRKSIKKVFAIGVSVAMLATTMVGALADLSTYPAPFINDNGVFNGAIVVGEHAATSDVLGAIDIAASLQAEAKSAVATSGSTVVVEGAKSYDDVSYGNWPAAETTLKKSKLAGFVDDSLEVDNNNIDYYDSLVIDENATTLVNPTKEEHNGVAHLEIADGAVRYKLNFDEDLFANDDGNSSATNSLGIDEDHPVEFKFLGQTIKAYDFKNSDKEFTVVSYVEKTLNEGDEVTVDGHTVSLSRVGDGSVIVNVDGDSKVIANTQSATFYNADDFEVEVNSIFYLADSNDNIASLRMGSALSKTVKPGDSAELFGEPSDESKADWVWTAGGDGTNSFIGIELFQNYNQYAVPLAAEERAPLAVGEALTLPNDYASLELNSLNAVYDTVEISMDDDMYLSDGDSNSGRFRVIKFKASDDIFSINSDTTDEVYVAYANDNNVDSNTSLQGIWYADGGDETYVGGTGATVAFDSLIDSQAVTFTVDCNTSNAYSNTGSYTTVISDALTTPETLTVESNFTADDYGFGSDLNGADAEDLLYSGAASPSIGEKDWDYETTYGIKIADVKAQFESGSKLTLAIPDSQQQATIVVSSKGSTVSSATSGSSYMINPISVGMGMLDSEATLGSKPMIVVGGPYANTIAKELLGFPSDEEIAQTFTEGKAMIKWFDDKQAMLVAGWSAQDTRGASYVVADYGNYDFTGNELEVVVTDLKNINVVAK